MSASASILNEKAFYGEKLGSHTGHSLSLVAQYSILEDTTSYGLDCDDCGALILDTIHNRQEALEIWDILKALEEEEEYWEGQQIMNDSYARNEYGLDTED